jgi:hypothetical protein
MSRDEKYAISEAKNASFKVCFGTRAFLASETSNIVSISAPSAFLYSGAEQSLNEPTALRVAQPITGAAGFAAAQFKC